MTAIAPIGPVTVRLCARLDLIGEDEVAGLLFALAAAAAAWGTVLIAGALR